MNKIKLITIELEKYQHLIDIECSYDKLHKAIEKSLSKDNDNKIYGIKLVKDENRDEKIKDIANRLLKELIYEIENGSKEDLNEAINYFGWNL